MEGRVLTLNNAQQDRAFIRQAIAYRLFAAAGLAAPRCNFARVRVNHHDLGLYVHVEFINKQFLRRHYVDPRGNLYEGVLSDFRPCWINTFETKTNRRTNNRADLWGLAAALATSDSSVLTEVAARVDLDQFLSYWAMEVLLKHGDGYAAFNNNFYLYHDPVTDRFQFLPWGIDRALRPQQGTGQQRPASVYAAGLLARRLYLLPQAQASYINRLQVLLNSVWDEKVIIQEIDRIEALITPIADPTGSAGLKKEIAEVREFVIGRRQAIIAELAAGPPAWNEPLPEPPCLQVVGKLSAAFSTLWDTSAANPFISGSGALAIVADGIPMQLGQVGANCGLRLSAPGGPWCVLNVVSQMAADIFAVVVCHVHQSCFASGQVLQSDGSNVFGNLFMADTTKNSVSLLATFGIGSVTLANAGMQPSSAVGGTISVDLVR